MDIRKLFWKFIAELLQISMKPKVLSKPIKAYSHRGFAETSIKKTEFLYFYQNTNAK